MLAFKLQLATIGRHQCSAYQCLYQRTATDRNVLTLAAYLKRRFTPQQKSVKQTPLAAVGTKQRRRTEGHISRSTTVRVQWPMSVSPCMLLHSCLRHRAEGG